jgi:hypothetical protein
LNASPGSSGYFTKPRQSYRCERVNTVVPPKGGKAKLEINETTGVSPSRFIYRPESLQESAETIFLPDGRMAFKFMPVFLAEKAKVRLENFVRYTNECI